MDPPQPDQQIRQLAFDFACSSTDGLSLWREQRDASIRRLGAELGYPSASSVKSSFNPASSFEASWFWIAKTYSWHNVARPCCGSGNTFFASERLIPAYASIDLSGLAWRRIARFSTLRGERPDYYPAAG